MKNQFINKSQNIIIFLLLAFLPISNVIVYFSTNILKFSPLITLWKECLMFGLILSLLFCIKFSIRNMLLILSLVTIIGIGIYSSFINIIPINQIIIGFRFELLWVILLVLVMVSNAIELKYFEPGIIIGFLFILLLSILSFIIGEDKLLSNLGFVNGWGNSGQELIVNAQLFKTPFCHSTNGGLTDCRLTAGFSSANNLAGYLLMVLFYFIYKFNAVKSKKYYYLILSFITITLLFFTYSRFAIIALLFSVIIFAIFYINKIPVMLKKVLIGLTLILPFLSVIVLQSVYENKSITSRLPSFIVKEGSSADHFKLTSIATEVIKRDGPKLILSGYGLSQTGPGAKSEYIDFNLSNFVKKNKDIAANIGIPDYNMSVPENWFLQVILNGGWIYGLLYFVLITFSISGLLGNKYNIQIILISLLSIIIGNLYLHLWESVTLNIYYSIFLLYYRFKIDNLSKLEHI
jgi:hypothetical protein